MTSSRRFSPRPGLRRGSALLAVVMLMLGISAASMALFYYHTLSSRSLLARNATQRADLAAEGAVVVLAERLEALAEERLGILSQADLDSLNTAVSTIEMPSGITLDETLSGYAVTAVREDERLPYDLEPIAVTPDHPRLAFSAAPPGGGALARQILEVEVIAATRSGPSGLRKAKTRLAIAKVLPFQNALETAGDAEVCVSNGSTLVINGPTRAHGRLLSKCEGGRTYSGGVQARGAIAVDPVGIHAVAWPSGSAALTSIDRATVEGATQSSLAAWGGRVRLTDALGDEILETSFQNDKVAGSGECPEVAYFDAQNPNALNGACGDRSRYYPSIQLQHTGSGTKKGEFDLRCGPAFPGGSCNSYKNQFGYYAYPFGPDVANPSAQPDPNNTNRLWQGFFPEYRRESRCTATVGGRTFRTYRCTSNPFGFVLNLGSIPPLRGGVISIKRSINTTAINPSGFQEVVLIHSAQKLQAPVTLHSELPVYIVGSFNNVSRIPAMIDAPLITVLPADYAQQTQTAMVWDSVGSPSNLVARQDAEIVGVLRSHYHLSEAGQYFGGVAEQIPSVLGDWSGVTLTVTGAVQGRWTDAAATSSYASWFQPYSATKENQVRQPKGRVVNLDRRLLTHAFQPLGSWYWENIPSSGAGGTRTRSRQVNAVGGYTVIWQTMPLQRGVQNVAVKPGQAIPGPILTNLIVNGSGQSLSNENFSAFVFSQTEQPGGAFGFFRRTVSAPVTLSVDQAPLPVDTTKGYRLEFFLRSTATTSPHVSYTGFMPYDRDGLLIAPQHHMRLADARLAQPLSPGDTILYLDNSSGWQNDNPDAWNRSLIIWNYKSSGGYNYGEYTYSRRWLNDAWANGAVDFATHQVRLAVPLAAEMGNPDSPTGTWPTGSAVSNGSNGSLYKFCVTYGVPFATTWTSYVGEIRGVDRSGSNAPCMLPPGGVSLKPVFLFGYGGLAETANVDLADVWMTERP